MILLPVCLALLVAYAWLMLYYRRGWVRMQTFKAAPDATSETRVTVIVPARNEEAKIARCLDGILGQDFPQEWTDVVVVDDGSTDRTTEIAKTYADKGVRLLSFTNGTQDAETAGKGKKHALKKGIETVSDGLVVTTDADCLHPAGWLRTLSEFHRLTGFRMIAAPVRYTRERSLLDVFQSLDFMTMQGITAVSVSDGLHAMANGANLCFEKSAFDAVGGYEGIDRIASGDDMLLMEKIWKAFPGKVGYCLSPDAVVDTVPPAGLKAFLSQRVRWASKAAFYRGWRIRSVLAMVYLLNLSLLALTVYAFFDRNAILPLTGLLLAKTAVESAFLVPVARFFGRLRLLVYFLPLQPLHILYMVVAGLLGQAGGYEWKGRFVK